LDLHGDSVDYTERLLEHLCGSLGVREVSMVGTPLLPPRFRARRLATETLARSTIAEPLNRDLDAKHIAYITERVCSLPARGNCGHDGSVGLPLPERSRTPFRSRIIEIALKELSCKG
jgi:hypothetical protein